MDLSEYEKMIADETLDPDQIEGGFDMIGGLEQEKKEVRVVATWLIKGHLLIMGPLSYYSHLLPPHRTNRSLSLLYCH